MSLTLNILSSFNQFFLYYLVSLGGWFKGDVGKLTQTTNLPINIVQKCKDNFFVLYSEYILKFNALNKIKHFHESFIPTLQEAKRNTTYYTVSAIEWWVDSDCLDIDFEFIFKYYPRAVGPVFSGLRAAIMFKVTLTYILFLKKNISII